MLSGAYNWMRNMAGYGESPEPDDMLSKLQTDLKNQTEELHKKLLVWQNIKREIIKSAPHLPFETYEEHHASAKEKIISIFAAMWKNIEGFLLPADQELREIKKRNIPHLQDLYHDLLELCDKLQDPFVNDRLSADEKIKLRFEICNTSIVMLTELLAMRDKVSDQISYCLRSEALGEAFANELIGMAVELFLKIPLPQTTFSMSDDYRDFLFDEIKDDETQLEDVVLRMEGLLDNAEEKEATAEKEPAKVSTHRSSLFQQGSGEVAARVSAPAPGPSLRRSL